MKTIIIAALLFLCLPMAGQEPVAVAPPGTASAVKLDPLKLTEYEATAYRRMVDSIKSWQATVEKAQIAADRAKLALYEAKEDLQNALGKINLDFAAMQRAAKCERCNVNADVTAWVKPQEPPRGQ